MGTEPSPYSREWIPTLRHLLSVPDPLADVGSLYKFTSEPGTTMQILGGNAEEAVRKVKAGAVDLWWEDWAFLEIMAKLWIRRVEHNDRRSDVGLRSEQVFWLAVVLLGGSIFALVTDKRTEALVVTAVLSAVWLGFSLAQLLWYDRKANEAYEEYCEFKDAADKLIRRSPPVPGSPPDEPFAPSPFVNRSSVRAMRP